MTENIEEKNAKAIAALFEDNNEEVEQELEAEESTEKVEDNNDEPQEEVEEDEVEEDEKENNDDEELLLHRQLSGWSKEQKEFVKSIKDPELRQKAIDAGKRTRADNDRLSLELGNAKKRLRELEESMQRTQSNKPIVANDEEDEYLTERELRERQKLLDVEKKLAEFEKREAEKEAEKVRNELQTFREATNADGSLKHPHLDRVGNTMLQFLQISDLSFEEAYDRAVMLDPELVSEIEEERKIKERLQKQALVKKVKQTNKYASKNAKVANKNLSVEERNRKAIYALFE